MGPIQRVLSTCPLLITQQHQIHHAFFRVALAPLMTSWGKGSLSSAFKAHVRGTIPVSYSKAHHSPATTKQVASSVSPASRPTFDSFASSADMDTSLGIDHKCRVCSTGVWVSSRWRPGRYVGSLRSGRLKNRTGDTEIKGCVSKEDPTVMESEHCEDIPSCFSSIQQW